MTKDQHQTQRRDFLFRSALGLGSVALGDLLLREQVGRAALAPNPLTMKEPVLVPRAKHVIFLLMQKL